MESKQTYGFGIVFYEDASGTANESDANAFAFQTVKEILGNSEALQALYSFWKPVEEVPAEQYNDLYD